MYRFFRKGMLFGTFGLLLPHTSLAHEVYVLSEETVREALASPRVSLWDVIGNDVQLFLFWTFIALVVVTAVFFTSISHWLENLCDPFLAKLPRYAPLVGRLTIGTSFLAAAYYQAIFGPEIPLLEVFGIYTSIATAFIALIGLLIILGLYTRIAAGIGLALFAFVAYAQGSYIFTYTSYAGELLLLTLLGAHAAGFHDHAEDVIRRGSWFIRFKEMLAPYAFLILRICFGASLIYASIYAKIINNQLAFAVTEQYPEVVAFFGFTPEFLVLGAAIIEILIGLFFILGVEIRFTALFMLFWLSLSIWYFGESVWPHIILIGIPITFILYGYDRYSVEGFFFKRDGREPVL